MALHWLPNELDSSDSGANECIERIRLGISASEFGYKTQALAAHVLLQLGYQIEAINQRGHPDIVALRDGREFRFEVEAEVTRPRPRKLTDADLSSLIAIPNVVGYYALAIYFPHPYWVLVPALKLVGRDLSYSNMLLEALSDRVYSTEWTREHLELLQNACRQIRLSTFGHLSQMALEGQRL